MSLVQRFVTERGGSFLMLGGAESFREGNIRPHGDRRSAARLSRQAAPAPAPRRAAAGVNARRLAAAVGAAARQRGRRAGAARHAAGFRCAQSSRRSEAGGDGGGDGEGWGAAVSALVTQRFGRGRSAALLVGDLWHAGLGDEALERGSRQGLAADRSLAGRRCAGCRSRSAWSRRPRRRAMRVQVRARDRKFQPLDNATVTLKVQAVGQSPESRLMTLPTEASPDEPGLYEATYLPRETGGYRVEAAGHRRERRHRRGRAGRVEHRSGGGGVSLAHAEPRADGDTRAQDGRRTSSVRMSSKFRPRFARAARARQRNVDATPLAHAGDVFGGAGVLRRGVGPAAMERTRMMNRSATAKLWTSTLAKSCTRWALGLLLRCALLSPGGAIQGEETADGRTSVILVVGAGGEGEYASTFSQWATHWQKACALGDVHLETIGADDAAQSSLQQVRKR